MLLVVGWVAADAVQPASYNPIRQTISVLAGHGGSDRWIMTSTLVAVGACDLVSAAGLRSVRAASRLLLGAAGVAAIGVATVPEPVRGSTPAHLAWTAFGAVLLAVWPATVGWRDRPHAPLLGVRVTVVTTAVFVAQLSWVIVETHYGGGLGLAERAATTTQTIWPFVVALALRRS